jgi:hypothetical protein
MGLTRLTLGILLAAAMVVAGCGSDDGGTGGTSGTGGTAGSGGGTRVDDPCAGSAACVVCGADALPQVITAFLPDGIRVPVNITATPEGDVVQGGTASIAVAAEAVLAIPPNESSIGGGSVTSFAAISGGEGTLDLMVPEQSWEGENVVVDMGSGTGEFTVDADATELVIQLDTIQVNFMVMTPVEVEVSLDVSDDGLCTLEGDGVSIPVQAAE